MLVKNKKPFSLGVVAALSFLGILLLIFSPVFNGRNGLEFADESFNKLAKGSSYFIPKISRTVDKFKGIPFSAVLKTEGKGDIELTTKLFAAAGVKVTASEKDLMAEGDLGALLQSVLKDADALYKNDGKTVSARYGYDEKRVMHGWWQSLSKMEKGMKKEKKLAEAKVVADVVKKAVEPGYNFYQIDANKVSEHAGMMSGLLVFYVIYTMWWGYSIFYMFEGVGLSMKKAKIKKEA